MIEAGVRREPGGGPGYAMRAFFWMMLCGGAFIADANFRRRDVAEVAIDWQVYLIVAVWAAAGLIALLNWRRSLRAVRTAGTFAVLVYFIVSLPVALVAPAPTYSMVLVVTNAAAFVFCVGVPQVLGRDRTVRALVFGAVAYLAISLILYALVPDIGQHRHEVTSFGVPFQRIAGLSHPNKIGWMAGLLLIATVTSLPRTLTRSVTWTVVLSLSLVCLVLAFSRTAFLGALLALLLSRALFRPLTWGLAIGTLVAAVALLVVGFGFGPGDAGLTLISRSGGGDTAEITTLTGRLLVWTTTAGFIAQSPIIGHGVGAIRSLLVDAFYGGGFVPDQAHNLYLNILADSGVVGLALLTVAFVQLVRRHRQRRDQFWLTAALFVGITGLTEAHLMAGPPSYTSLVVWCGLGVGLLPHTDDRTVPFHVSAAPV